jgi:ketosteroid isomerase-like protein
MSERNVEIVRRLAQAGDSEGYEAALAVAEEIFAEDVEWVEDPSWPGGGAYRGLPAIRALLAERTDSFAIDQITERLIDAGDDVVSFIRWRGRGESSGAEADMRVATVLTLRDGKVTRVRFFLDRAEALRAVGLSDAELER